MLCTLQLLPELRNTIFPLRGKGDLAQYTSFTKFNTAALPPSSLLCRT
jgi:hypothetical protein